MTDTRDDTLEEDSPFRSPQVLETYQEESAKVQLLRTVAFYQKFLLISIGLHLVFLPLGFIDFPLSDTTVLSGFSVFYLAFILLGIISVFPIVYRIQNLITAIFCSLLAFFPCFNLLALLIVNHHANAFFRDHGLTTNWLGPDLRTLPKDGEDETEANNHRQSRLL